MLYSFSYVASASVSGVGILLMRPSQNSDISNLVSHITKGDELDTMLKAVLKPTFDPWASLNCNYAGQKGIDGGAIGDQVLECCMADMPRDRCFRRGGIESLGGYFKYSSIGMYMYIYILYILLYCFVV